MLGQLQEDGGDDGGEGGGTEGWEEVCPVAPSVWTVEADQGIIHIHTVVRWL